MTIFHHVSPPPLTPPGHGEFTPLMMPEISPELLFAGVSPSKDSIEELSSFSMLEPSFLHPGTLSAHPDAWKIFTAMLDNTREQVRLPGCGEPEPPYSVGRWPTSVILPAPFCLTGTCL